MKAVGGIAPFGYRWKSGRLVVDENEAPVRKLIYELFLKHRRKKTIAKILNDLGYRTRNASLFSDTTIDRLLRDTTAKGIRLTDGKIIEIEPIVSTEIWEQVNLILGSKPLKQTKALFSGIAYCGCGGKMLVLRSTHKYGCADCKNKILADDLEAVFCSQLADLPHAEIGRLDTHWGDLTQKEKRILVEHICDRIVIERDTITIRFGSVVSPHPLKPVTDEQRNSGGNETPKSVFEEEPKVPLSEPLLSEAAAAEFLGISKTTLLRKRYAREIGYFRVGHRVLYSKEKHLIRFLAERESGL